MGLYKERLATTITANLLSWRLRGTDAAEGIIYGSYTNEYRDGEKRIFLNVRLTHFRHNEGFWPDHYLMSTYTGSHFMLIAKDQIASDNDTSVA